MFRLKRGPRARPRSKPALVTKHRPANQWVDLPAYVDWLLLPDDDLRIVHRIRPLPSHVLITLL